LTPSHGSIINLIRILMEKQWQLSFKHTLREGHQCADWFTKHGASNDASLVVLDSCPTTISSLLLADAMHFVRG